MNILLDIIVNAIEVAYVYYITSGYERRKSKVQVFCGYLCLLMFNIGINTLWERQFEWVKVLICLIAVFVFIKEFYSISFLKKIILTIIYFMSVTVGEIIVIGYLMLVNEAYTTYALLSSDLTQLVAVICSKTVTWIILNVVKRFQFRIDIKSNIIEHLFIILPNITYALIIMISLNDLLGIQNNAEKKMETIYIIVVTSIIAIGMASHCILSEIYFKEKYDKEILENVKANLLFQSKYYKEKFETEIEIRKLYHDLKNYALYLENSKDKVAAKKLFEPIWKYQNYVETGDEFLDLLISEKLNCANAKGIHTECFLRLPQKPIIQSIDICVIMGNALDNAIEGAENDKQEGNAYIEIRGKEVENFYLIQIENSTTNSVEVLDHEFILTSKSDKGMHGMGIASIKETLRKYSGQITIEWKDYRFILRILIPM